MNYKKSIMSLAAVLALSSSVTADPNATYVPLTNKTNDNAWIMFGVNDFSTGLATASSSTGAFSVGTSTVTEADNTDDLASPSGTIITTAAAGTIFEDSTGGKNMATFQSLLDSTGSAYITDSIEMAIKTSDTTSSETQPVRSMYIAIEGSETIAKIKLNYKSILEGRSVELQFGGAGSVYTATISESATFNNPAVAKVEPAVVVAELDEQDPANVLAYDLSASPILASAYSVLDHQGTSAGAERFYHYDATNAQWILWDRAKVAETTNTLTKFKRGNAYWGRMDIDSSGATGSTTKAGLYLGKSGLTEADSTIYTGDLTPSSWNMVAFDPASHPDMRNAATGLKVTTNALADGDSFIIVDETGTNSVTVTFPTAADYDDGTAKISIAVHINNTIEIAKMLGEVPDTFNVKAFNGVGGIGDLIFLSDKQFTLKDLVGDLLFKPTTIAGVDSVINFDGTNAAIADIGDGVAQGTTGATSVYGEYAMIIEALTATNADASGAAAELDFSNTIDTGTSTGSASVQFGNIDGDSSVKVTLAGDDLTTTVATAQATFDADEVFDATKSTGVVTEIDTDFDGTTDMLLAAASAPFYVKDNTFTRIYTLDTSADGTGTGAVSFNISPADVTVTPTAADAIGDVVDDINDQADNVGTQSTEVYAAADGANTLVVITKNSKVFELEDADSATVDYFSNGSLNKDIAKGAIKRVVNIADLAREKVLTNKFTVTFTAESTGDGVATFLSINTQDAANANTLATAGNDTNRITMLDDFVAKANAAMKANDIAGFATHNYVNGMDDITQAIITVEGVGISALTFTEDDTTIAATADGEQNTNPGTLNVDGALIVSDLKANPVYTPDYVNYGPLYTLKSAGYEVKTLIRASTKLANTPTTHWSHIDLTRDSKDWLKNNEFNLFSVDNSAGYWAYIEDYTLQNDIANGAVIFTPSFAYHFNTKTGASDSLLNAATFSVEITDTSAAAGILDEETSNAKLVIGGNEIQLTKSGTKYTAVLTQPETNGLSANTGNNIAIGLKAADGLGESYTNSSLIDFDYDKPDAPTVTFNNGVDLAFTSTSADVASYYIWEGFVPDDGNSLTPTETALSITDALAYNICTKSAYEDTSSYKVVAFDGTGIFGGANASNITGFTYVNTLKGATVQTHTQGEVTSTVTSYDGTCVVDAAPVKSGVEAKAIQSGEQIVLSYIAIDGTNNNKDDLPYSAFYETTAGVDIVQVDVLPAYASQNFFVEYDGVLYKGTFPADATTADASFADPIDLVAVASDNQSLD